MACEVIHTGSRFLAATLANIDCQGRAIGAYGFGALADAGSPVAHALTAILTIFVALFGIRLMLGRGFSGLDFVDDAVRVGLFLALATSWPAWRVVAYDLVLDGPAQVAGSIGRPVSLPGATNDLIARLQDADNGIVALTMFGSGRLTGGISGGSDLGDVTSGVALADQTALGWGRATFLATVIGVNGLLRIGSGLLLALAPLMAGLILFTGTRSVFVGWLRGLGFFALSNLAFSILTGVELALLFPWLTDVLSQRQANVLTPSAPTELFVLTFAFALSIAGILLVIARIMFLPVASFVRAGHGWLQRPLSPMPDPQSPATSDMQIKAQNRAQSVVSAVEMSLLRENGASPANRGIALAHERRDGADGESRSSKPASAAGAHLGETWRRTSRRTSLAGQRRDRA